MLPVTVKQHSRTLTDRTAHARTYATRIYKFAARSRDYTDLCENVIPGNEWPGESGSTKDRYRTQRLEIRSKLVPFFFFLCAVTHSIFPSFCLIEIVCTLNMARCEIHGRSAVDLTSLQWPDVISSQHLKSPFIWLHARRVSLFIAFKAVLYALLGAYLIRISQWYNSGSPIARV